MKIMLRTLMVGGLLCFSVPVWALVPITLDHTITYTAKGSRSEAQHGHLWVDGEELPKVFTRVSRGQLSYRLHQRQNLWGADGYHPETPAVLPTASSDVMPIIARERGYYLGEKRLKDTPEDWLCVEWGQSQRAFVAPKSIENFIATHKLRPMSNMEMMEHPEPSRLKIR